MKTENLEKCRLQKRKWYEANREKMKVAARVRYVEKREEITVANVKWARANSARVAANQRRAQLKRKFGLSVADVAVMLSKQSGRCAGCKVLFSKTPHVDHDHLTEFVRGLLCKKCNTALGLVSDSEGTLLALVDYLRRSRYEQTKQGDK